MDSISPVWTEQEIESEHVIALDQPEYVPIIILPVVWPDGTEGMSVRFRLSKEEIAALSRGADLVITEITFGQPFTPIKVQICNPNERP